MVVFKIQNKVTQQHYVGSCRSDIFERWELYVRAAEAGLDFPLYREIREHGEAAFAVAELDFAEDIAELKEMELLHTVELCARSLRGYKFGRSDVVVKRCRQADLNNAWMKDLPEPDRPVTAPSARLKVQKTARVATDAPASPAEPVVAAATPPLAPSASRSVSPPEPERAPAAPTPPVKTPAAASGELDKALFAEGVGLLVRTLGCFEQLDQQRQQADKQAEALAQALNASSQALAELEGKQRLAAERALQAQAAVEASFEANAVLGQAQDAVRENADTLVSLLRETGAAVEGMGALQQGVTELLGRLKRTGANGEGNGGRGQVLPMASAPAATAPPAAPSVPDKSSFAAGKGAHGAEVEPRAGAEKADAGTQSAAADPRSREHPEVDPAELAAQEARMVNGLKGLDKLLAGAEKAQNEPEVLDKPARAWIAADRGAQGPRVLEKKPLAAATVVHRRSRPGPSRPGRKTLSIRAR